MADKPQTRNREGKWVQSIPLPFYGIRKKCPEPGCGEYYFTMKGYRNHYAYKHILKYT